MAALLRRPAALVVMLALALLSLPAAAFADGRDVLADYEDNGQIDRCYTRAEFDDALRLVREDQRIYGAAADVVQEARVTNLKRPGQPCPADADTAAVPVSDDSGGGGIGLWIGLAVAVGAVAVGAGAWARRGGDEPGDEDPGAAPPS